MLGNQQIGEAVIAISEEELRTHQGNAYTYSHLISALANAGTFDFRVTTPTSPANIKLTAKLMAAGAHTLQIREAATFSVAGTGQTPVNRRRTGTPAVSAVVLQSAPTTSGTGNLLVTQNQVDPGLRLQLKASTEYLLRVTNSSGGVADSVLRVDFAEEFSA